MLTLQGKLFNSVVMAVAAIALSFAGMPATAHSYRHNGSHHSDGHEHHHGGHHHHGHHYGGYYGYPYYGNHHYGGYYGYPYYGSHYYGGYYNYPYYGDSYRSYRHNSYREPDDTVSHHNDYSTSGADDRQGWSLLAHGEQRRALKTFATQAQNNPKNGTIKVGYALAAADGGDLDRGVWAMRRAMRIDPDSLHYLTLDEDLKGIVNHLITRYKNDSHYNVKTTDRDFMLASLYYLLHDTASAGSYLPERDTHTSAKNLDHLIHQQ